MGVIRRRGDRQQPAERLDPEDSALLVNERDLGAGAAGRLGLERRSSAAWAQYADAGLRLSLAWRSARPARSSACRRARVRSRPGAQAQATGCAGAEVAFGLAHPRAQGLGRRV